MKTFKKLEITGAKIHLIKLLNKIKSDSYQNFTYIEEKSDDYAKMINVPKENTGTFLSSEIYDVTVYIWLVIDEDRLYVSNITPNKSGQLSYDLYNNILDKFKGEVIDKHFDGNENLVIHISKENETIEDLAGDDTADKLKNWINSANYTTLNTNPHDFKRWCQFIFSAYRNSSKLNSTQFEKYLIQEIKLYDEDLISKIVVEYEYSLDLLKEYDRVKEYDNN